MSKAIAMSLTYSPVSHIYAMCGCGEVFHETSERADAHFKEWRENHPCELRKEDAMGKSKSGKGGKKGC